MWFISRFFANDTTFPINSKTTQARPGVGNQSWLRLSEQFPANDKWRSGGFRLLGGTGCWV
jgi:hypothetical protein